MLVAARELLEQEHANFDSVASLVSEQEYADGAVRTHVG